MAVALEMVHDIDPKQEIMDDVAPFLNDIEPLAAQVLIGIYVRPKKTSGGIYIPDNTQGEDIYQGKVGLVLKLGPLAFSEDESHKWGGRTPQVGDWVLFRVGDTFPFSLGKRHCRAVEDVNFKFILHKPDIAY